MKYTPYLLKDTKGQPQDLVRYYKIVHIILQNEIYMTTSQKRAILAWKQTTKRTRDRKPPPREERSRLQGAPWERRRLPPPSCGSKEDPPGSPVIEASSGSASCKQGGTVE